MNTEYQKATAALSRNRTTAIYDSSRLKDAQGGIRLEALGKLAHELRTPIQILLGYLDALPEDLPQNTPAASRRMIARMNVTAVELARIVENLMEFALVDAQAEADTETEVATLDLIDEIMPLIEAANHDKNLKLKFELDDAPPTIRARHRQLHLMLSNLAVNAIRFTAAGRVTIAIRQSGTPEQPAICFEVSDTGVGFRREVHAQIFEPFAQLSSSNRRRYRGVGLGLTVVKRCVAALKGTIEVYSKPGQGSRFVVNFPVQPAPTGAAKGN
ncbi:MAG: HAMP domain-containing histidine kinase [Candidatus Binataceae bacterium]|nr:HAMP domain-containing histidine kinase [Candidatus Binataceae bacterium]